MNTAKVSNNKRNHAIDFAKGIGILCVIAAHYGLPQNLTVFLYAFHLPIFFIASGWFFNASQCEQKFSIYLKRKIKGYLKPYIVLGLTMVVYILVADGYRTGINLLLELVAQRRCSTLWFLSALFLANVIFFFVVKLFKSKMFIFIISTIISIVFILYDTFVGISLVWNLDTAFIAQIFLACGFCFRNRIEELAQGKRLAIVCGVCGILLCFLFTKLNHILKFESFEMYGSSYGCFPLTVLAAISGSLGIIFLCHVIQIKIISDLGKNSIVYFGLHQSVAQPLAIMFTKFLLDLVKVQNAYVSYVSGFCFIILICFIIDKVYTFLHIKQWMLKKQ